MNWFLLVVAGLLEIGRAVGLKTHAGVLEALADRRHDRVASILAGVVGLEFAADP